MPEYRGNYYDPRGPEMYRRPPTPRISGPEVNAVRLIGITERRPPNRVKTVFMAIVLAAVIVGLVYGGITIYNTFFSEGFTFFGKPISNVKPGQSVSVVIYEGATTSEIARVLREKGIIADEQSFRTRAFERGADILLKPGTYTLITGMDLDELINMLVIGPIYIDTSTRLTIPEGLTIEQTAARVERICEIPADEFIALAYSADTYVKDYAFLALCLPEIHNNSLEGFLYPKTYNIPQGATADTVIRILLNQFAIETKNLDLTYATSRNVTLFDVITMSSLIERETAALIERPLVSSVIYNRLRTGMRLQIDATVVYALGPSYNNEPLTYAQLEIDSPYNTYKVYQLPIGPICSAHISSIEAAAHPQETNYLYYVLTSKEGFHTFCATYEEFLIARDKYNELFGIS